MMDNRIWRHQCQDCGKRFPSYQKLTKHERRMHGTRAYCPVEGCNWSCSSHDLYRLRTHQRRHFTPAETPRPDYSVSSVVIPVGARFIQPPQKIATPSWGMGAETRAALEHYDQQMPDFAVMLNEPRTPSPMRRLIAEETPEEAVPIPEDLALIPSDQLFSSYLPTTETSDKDPLSYSPSDPPFLTQFPETSSSTAAASPLHTSDQTISPVNQIQSKSPSPNISPLNFTPATIPLSVPTTTTTSASSTSAASPVTSSPATSASSMALSIPSSTKSDFITSPLALDLTLSSTTVPVVSTAVPAVASESNQSSTSDSTDITYDQPLDLSVSKHQGPKIIPTEGQTPVIDCTTPTGRWTTPARITLDQPDRLYAHLCLDPRVFFAGAPSHYMRHPLAQTLSSARTASPSMYQRRLIPIGTKSIMKEERCILKDGSSFELRDIWTSD